jgi:hypothetical protein
MANLADALRELALRAVGTRLRLGERGRGRGNLTVASASRVMPAASLEAAWRAQLDVAMSGQRDCLDGGDGRERAAEACADRQPPNSASGVPARENAPSAAPPRFIESTRSCAAFTWRK